ncbi:MAG: PP2C family protein-serine/threonine phosphatase [Bacillota bacterium]
MAEKDLIAELEDMKTIMKKQLKIAKNVQKTIINTELPQGLDGEVFYRPVLKSGGDFYDFVKLENDKYGYLLADNKKQGLSAILIMIALKFIFEKLNHNYLSPAEVLKKIDNKMKEEFSGQLQEIKITLCYIIIDTKNRKISWANASHPYPLLIDNQNNWINLEFTSSPLTKNSKVNLEYKEINYKKEAKLFSYTDGLADFLATEEDFLPPEIIEDIVSEFATGRSGKSEFYEWLIAKLDNIEYYDNICYTLINL